MIFKSDFNQPVAFPTSQSPVHKVHEEIARRTDGPTTNEPPRDAARQYRARGGLPLSRRPAGIGALKDVPARTVGYTRRSSRTSAVCTGASARSCRVPSARALLPVSALRDVEEPCPSRSSAESLGPVPAGCVKGCRGARFTRAIGDSRGQSVFVPRARTPGPGRKTMFKEGPCARRLTAVIYTISWSRYG